MFFSKKITTHYSLPGSGFRQGGEGRLPAAPGHIKQSIGKGNGVHRPRQLWIDNKYQGQLSLLSRGQGLGVEAETLGLVKVPCRVAGRHTGDRLAHHVQLRGVAGKDRKSTR